MKNNMNLAQLCSLLFLIITLGACSVTDGTAGIEGTGAKDGDLVAARGSVTRFGSIYVNGIHFDTDNAAFFIAGEEVSEDAIKQGMVVYVEGTPGENTREAQANVVSFDYIVKGRIESIDNINSNTRLINMLGYSITLSEDAMVDGNAFDLLKSGDFIAISGLLGDGNTITATRVDLPETTSTVVITGVITAKNEGISSIEVNKLTVDYSTAVITGGSLDSMSNGVTVKIKGELNADSNTLMATQIQLVVEKAPIKQRLSEEGLISNFISNNSFMVNGIQIDASSAESSGDQLKPLKNGSRVSVTGLVENRQLKAESIYIYHQSSSRISGPVSGIDPEAGTITISGINFYVGSHTNFEDLGPRRNRYFDLDDLSVGDDIDIFSEFENSEYTTITLRRKPIEEQEITIKGTISSFVSDSNARFYLFGILIDAQDISDYVLSQLNLEDSVFVTGEYIDNTSFKAKAVYILKNKCTSHREDDCQKQTPWFKPDDQQDGRKDSEPETNEPNNDFDSFDKALGPNNTDGEDPFDQDKQPLKYKER